MGAVSSAFGAKDSHYELNGIRPIIGLVRKTLFSAWADKGAQ
jgi:hypothetical protein